MLITEGLIFGLISGCLTSIGLVFSNIGAKSKINLIVLVLISLALSDSISDALGIYYSTYKDDSDIYKSIKEGLKALIGKAIIPLLMVLIFLLSQNIIQAGWIIIIFVGIIFLYINYIVFNNNNIRIINIIIFITIILINYYLGLFFK
jgi:vacuolar iron transporter family protein